MKRLLLTVAAFALLAALATAQNAASGPSAYEQLELLRKNTTLLDTLLEQGLKLSAKNTPLDRADECVSTAERLALDLKAAVARGDAERVSELGDYLQLIVSDGCLPNLREVERTTDPNSPGYTDYLRVRDKARATAVGLATSIPTDGTWSKAGSVQRTRERLVTAVNDLNQPAQK